MFKSLLASFLISYSINGFSQDYTDSKRLKNLDYMILAKNIDCNNHENSDLEIKICLNLEFQEIDSIMNQNFIKFLKQIDDSVTINLLKHYQLNWVKNRKLQSEIISKNYQRHMFGILYLSSMIISTTKRNEELLELLGFE